jgi:hypothetical protein
LHAGGFTGGNKSNDSSLCDELADYGFIPVAFDYRTGYIKIIPMPVPQIQLQLFNAVYRAMQDGMPVFVL